MINKKILISAMSIVTSLAVVGGATFAFFSDAGSSTDNIFSTGNLDMQLSNDNSTFTNDVAATFGLAGAAPGDTFDDTLFVRNTGTVPANHIEVTAANTVTEAGSGPGTVSTIPFDRAIEITALDWDSDGNGSTETSVLSQVTDLNSNTIIDLDDLENSTGLDNLLFGGTQSAGHGLRVAGRLHPTITENQHQGDSVSVDFSVTMNQDASQ